MPKKKTEVNSLNLDSVIDHMRALRRHPSYEVLIGALGIERSKILESGKKSKDVQERADCFVRLDGFDSAFGLISRYANMKKKDERGVVAVPFEN